MEKPIVSKPGIILWFMQVLLFLEVASDKELFSFEYLDKDFNVLSLRCHGDCTTQAQPSSIVSIAITNSTSQALVAIGRSAQSPVVTTFLQDVVYYVGGALTPDHKSCSLEVIIKNCKILARLEFKCDVSTSLSNGSIITRSIDLKVDKRAPQDATHSLPTSTLAILIVVIIALFLVAVFFLCLWLRGRRRPWDDVVYQTPTESEISHKQAHYTGSGSVLSIAKSPSKLSFRKASDMKFPDSHGSVRRMTSRRDNNIAIYKIAGPTQPPVPPPNLYFHTTSQNSVISDDSSVTAIYTQRQDALESEFSEDGDVTSGNDEPLKVHSGSSLHIANSQNTGLYSCVPVKSARLS